MEEERKKDEKSLGFGIEDFDDVKFDPNWTRMDCLVAVAEHALIIYNRRKIAKGMRIEEEDDDHSEKPIKTRFSDREKNKRIRKQKIVAIKTEDIENRQETRKRGRSRVCRASTTASAPAAAAAVDDDDQEHQEKSVEEQEGNRNKRQKKKNTARATSSSSVPPQLPQEYRRALERFAAGKSIEELNFILRKDVYKTDVSPTHCRLSLPKNKQQHSYLTKEEENI